MTRTAEPAGAAAGTPPAPATAPRQELPGQERVLGNMFPASLLWTAPGDVHVIEVAGVGVVQDQDFDTQTPLTWPSGDPKMVMVVYGPADDGPPGSWWTRGRRATKALRDALKAVNITGLAAGDIVIIARGPDEEIPPKNGKGKTMFANTWDVTVKPAGGV